MAKKQEITTWGSHFRGIVIGALLFWLTGWCGWDTLLIVGFGYLFGAGAIKSFSTLLLSFLFVLKIFFLLYGFVLTGAESFSIKLYSWMSSIAVLSLFLRMTTLWIEELCPVINKKDPSGQLAKIWGIITTLAIPLLCVGIVVAYHYRELSSTATMFGERLNYYDKSIAAWDGNRACNPEVKEDGRVVMKLTPRKRSRYFDEYTVHLLPISKKNFLISANKIFDTREEAKAHFDTVKRSLSLKYGDPFIDKEFSASYKNGKVEIGLICTELTGRPMVYVNALIRSMLENDLKRESKKFNRERDLEQDAL